MPPAVNVEKKVEVNLKEAKKNHLHLKEARKKNLHQTLYTPMARKNGILQPH